MRGILRTFWNFLAIRCVRALLVPVMLAWLLTGLETSSASAATCVSCSGTPADNSGVPDNVLTATSVLSPCDAWAVGAYSDGAGDRTLILHWNGSGWAPVASPNPGSTTSLSAIDAV